MNNLITEIFLFILAVIVFIGIIGLFDFLLFYFIFKDSKMSDDELRSVAKGWRGEFDE